MQEKDDMSGEVWEFSNGESPEKLIDRIKQEEDKRLRDLWDNATPEMRETAYRIVAPEGDAG